MSTRKRLLAGASAVALAAGTTLAGAGLASAQGSSEIAADLGLAAQALSGPVTVSSNAEGGPTVVYENASEVDQTCVGFTMPYSTVEEQDIDPGGIGGDVFTALPLLNAIEDAGDVHILTADEDGAPISFPSEPGDGIDDPDANGVIAAAVDLLSGGGLSVPAGGSGEWTASGPDSPAAGVLLCTPDPEDEEALLDINFGIDTQVVADQINGQIPGGSVDIVSADQITPGSVETGATAIGSLAGLAGDDGDTGDGDTGDTGDGDTGEVGLPE